MKSRRLLLGLLCGMAGLSVAGEGIPPPTGALSYTELRAAVKEGRYDVEGLRRLLRDPEATTGLMPNQERAALNDVMAALLRVESPESPVEDLLMEVAMDSSRDPGVREYAVQHLLLWHPKTPRKAKVEEMLWTCTEDPVLSSCAILQLHHLGMRTEKGLSRPLAPAVFGAMARQDLRNADKITLLLVAAESGMTAALPIAKTWAEATSEKLVLQAALTAIGKLGGPGDLAFLDALETRRNLDDVRKTVEFARGRLGAEMIKGEQQ